jgi:hypothetical protein
MSVIKVQPDSLCKLSFDSLNFRCYVRQGEGGRTFGEGRTMKNSSNPNPNQDLHHLGKVEPGGKYGRGEQEAVVCGYSERAFPRTQNQWLHTLPILLCLIFYSNT